MCHAGFGRTGKPAGIGYGSVIRSRGPDLGGRQIGNCSLLQLGQVAECKYPALAFAKEPQLLTLSAGPVDKSLWHIIVCLRRNLRSFWREQSRICPYGNLQRIPPDERAVACYELLR